jgi:hypothetical protein
VTISVRAGLVTGWALMIRAELVPTGGHQTGFDLGHMIV